MGKRKGQEEGEEVCGMRKVDGKRGRGRGGRKGRKYAAGGMGRGRGRRQWRKKLAEEG